MSKGMMSGGAVLVAIAIILTQYLGGPGYLHYLWAGLVLIWGFIALK